MTTNTKLSKTQRHVLQLMVTANSIWPKCGTWTTTRALERLGMIRPVDLDGFTCYEITEAGRAAAR